MAIPLRATTLAIATRNQDKSHDAPGPTRLPFSLYPKKRVLRAPGCKFRGLCIARAITPTAGPESSEVGEGSANLFDSVQVFDLNGNAISISDLWKDRKAVVAFARHFGCVLCRKRADYLAAQKDKMDAAGVTLILIGPGSVDQANSFAEQTKFRGEIYADPNRSSYEALQFVSGVTTTFTPGAGLKIIQAYMEGYRQDWELSFEKETRTRGGWQQGGIIVAGPGKYNILYIHRDKEAGDDPDIEEILKLQSSPGSFPFSPTTSTYNILMKACGTDYFRAKALMDEMKMEGLSPNHISWSILIDIFGGTGNIEGALRILRSMHQAGVQPDVVTYTTAIKVCVEQKNLKFVFSLFAEMKRYQIKPNLVTYNTLLRARSQYGSLQEVQQCLAIYQDMRKAGYQPNDYYLKQLIGIFC